MSELTREQLAAALQPSAEKHLKGAFYDGGIVAIDHIVGMLRDLQQIHKGPNVIEQASRSAYELAINGVLEMRHGLLTEHPDPPTTEKENQHG